MESFGRYLKSERENRGISIEEIARATKIGAGQLRALESDDLAALPTTTFVKGFIRAYAKHIGIEPDDTVVRFESYLQEIEQDENSSMEFAVPFTFKRDTPLLGLALVAGGIILLVVIVFMIFVRACGEKATVTIEPGGAEPARVFNGSVSLQASDGNHDPLFRSPIVPAQPDEREGQKVTSPLPTVPPDAFRVRRIAPSYSSLSVIRLPGKGHVPDEDSNPGGGDTPHR